LNGRKKRPVRPLPPSKLLTGHRLWLTQTPFSSTRVNEALAVATDQTGVYIAGELHQSDPKDSRIKFTAMSYSDLRKVWEGVPT
jgi:hypothetical protein